MSVSSNKDQFIFLLKEVQRDGVEDLLNWLEGTDFFTAPASTRFHLSEEGGLCQHSLNVYRRLSVEAAQIMPKPSRDSIILTGLLHDVCKANFYTVEYRNAKNEYGQWEKVPYYTVKDQFPMGHGEKSVFLIERFLRLTEEEAIAIRWHMGGFDESVRGGSFSAGNAFELYPLAVALHVADLKATYYAEI